MPYISMPYMKPDLVGYEKVSDGHYQRVLRSFSGIFLLENLSIKDAAHHRIWYSVSLGGPELYWSDSLDDAMAFASSFHRSPA